MRTNKLRVNLTTRKIYWKYRKHVQDNNLGEKYLLPEPKYSKIIKLLHENIKETILSNVVFKMPHLGYRIKIVKFKRNPLDKDGNFIPYSFPVDWKETRALWKEHPELKQKKLIYILNDHTDGYIYKIKMFPASKVFWHTKFYKFTPSATFKQNLTKILKDPYNKQDYYEL